MNHVLFQDGFFDKFTTVLAVFLGLSFSLLPAQAQVSVFKQAIATEASKDASIAGFYRVNGYRPIWIAHGSKAQQRRKEFLKALESAADHGLPVSRYNPSEIRARLKATKADVDRARLEVDMSRMFLQYADDMRSGALKPQRIDRGMVRKVVRYNRTETLIAFAKKSPRRFIRGLATKTPEYTRLMKEKRKLEKLMARGGYGPKIEVPTLQPGASGAQVVALRNRLIAMGYLRKSSTQSYDTDIQKAVRLFQRDNGLATDGVVSKRTMSRLNIPSDYRLRSIIVAMERERWFNRPRGKRHVLVNITDFTTKIIENNKVTFLTRAVIGKNAYDRRTPEFSDEIRYMVINPTWNVPRSIAIDEYLPLLKEDPLALGHLNLFDENGQTVSRDMINFEELDELNFPYDMKQPPSRGNALGLVKFMFPNEHNIYLHDSPEKQFFQRSYRAHSHGCVRLHRPFDFAYALLGEQMKNPEAFFQAKLRSLKETPVPLETAVPVHLIYRTAVSKAKGGMEYRRDVYGRDAKIFRALHNAGVVLAAVRR